MTRQLSFLSSEQVNGGEFSSDGQAVRHMDAAPGFQSICQPTPRDQSCQLSGIGSGAGGVLA